MKITYNWLKDFVEIKISAPALAEKLTMVGLEVTSLEERAGDFVFEIEVTANRPDCLSVIGIAREVAAVTGRKLKVAAGREDSQATGKGVRHAACGARQLAIKIENKKDCPLYIAKIIRGVSVGPSPDWLKQRLELVGCRSVNNIVDITNYILFTYGEPLHAFDLDKFSHQASNSPGHQLEIKIRRAKDQEKIITIDGAERMLGHDILVIADKNRPIAVAGVMGGKETEVTVGTRNILLEAAIFNPIIIRRGRQKLGLQSESSYRFERGVDLEIVEKASREASRLIQELTGATYLFTKASGSRGARKKAIRLDAVSPHKILGIDIAAAKLGQILNSLGFELTIKTKNSLTLKIPSHRPDVREEIDLIEEVARVYGYDRIPVTLPKVRARVITLKPHTGRDAQRRTVSLIKNILAGLGLNEVVTYSLIDQEALKIFPEEPACPAIEILNPLSKEQGFLRSTLVPGLLRCIALNLNQKQDYISIFEVAKVFFQQGGQAKEELTLGIGLCGTKSLLLGQGLIKEEAGWLYLKGILETLFKRLGIRDYNLLPAHKPSQAAVFVGKEKIGSLSELPPQALEKFDIKNKNVFVLELSLEKLLPCVDSRKRFVPLPIFPGVTRDISFILKENLKAEDILATVREKAGPLLQEAKIIDYYQGKQIPDGFKSLTISCFYRSDERTLTESEINPIQSLVCAALTERFRVKFRT